jgi:multidrug efflux pump
MNFSNIFIDRPILAGVLSTLILICGLISMPLLPISEYPEVVPPSVVVSAAFPGANPKTIAETVAAPLEEQINGVENMLYMSSQSSTDGRMGITVTFKIGTDPDLAQQLVQNRVNQALPRLPEVTRQLGVTTIKSSPDLTMVVHLTSPDARYDMLYLRNYATLNVKDRLSRIPGIGRVEMFGSGDYAMRVWLNPDKIAERNLNASDVVRSIRSQNIQVAAGLIGATPAAEGVEMQLPINAQGRLTSPEEFGQIVVKRDANGAVTYLSDIARIEMGAANYSLRSLLDNQPAVAIPIFQMPGANAIEISDNVRKAMAELKTTFPEGMGYSIVYDPTVFVRDSIKAVIKTLLEAVALVVLVVIVFLQTWRASVIPLLAVPVSIVGTFAVLHMFGFSINALSLFGLVLAVGIVVDDAIVVVENVERNIREGLAPHAATRKAMAEVSGPIIAIMLTLCAVFIPIAFISGLTGQFYKQFALTIAISTVISTFNSLTLSPALAAMLLKDHHAPKDKLTRIMDKYLGGFFAWFNRFFDRNSNRYAGSVSGILRYKSLSMGVYLFLLLCAYGLFNVVPGGFVPGQDKQYLVGFAQLPDGASLERTEAVIRTMSDIALKEQGVQSAVAFPGLSINGFINSASAGIVFVTLKPFDERTSAALSGNGIAQSLQMKYMGVKDAFIAIFPPPPVMGLGTIGGFKLQVQDRGDMGYEALNAAMQAVQQKAWGTPQLAGVFSSYKINVPQLQAEVDRVKAMQLGVEVPDVFETMQTYLGSLYVNDFNKFGRTYQVIAQADAEYRSHAEDITRLKVRNSTGQMVPLGSIVTVTES